MDRYKLLEGVDTRRALFGLFFTFDNRLQTAGDAFYEEITCKQFFLLICMYLFVDNPPTISELAELMGSSHQNVKQLVNKLQERGFVRTYLDETDKRKLRVVATEKKYELGEKYKEKEIDFMNRFYAGVTEEEIEATFKTISKIESNLVKIREEFR